MFLLGVNLDLKLLLLLSHVLHLRIAERGLRLFHAADLALNVNRWGSFPVLTIAVRTDLPLQLRRPSHFVDIRVRRFLIHGSRPVDFVIRCETHIALLLFQACDLVNGLLRGLHLQIVQRPSLSTIFIIKNI